MKKRKIISYIILWVIIKIIITVQQDFNNLIEIYSNILNEFIELKGDKLNKCQPPVCNRIDDAWKLNNIEMLKQHILKAGNLRNWVSYKRFKEIIIDSIKELCCSEMDPRTAKGSTWFDKLRQCEKYSEDVFINYTKKSNFLNIHSLEYKLFSFLIPTLSYFGLSTKILNELLLFLSINYLILFIIWLRKYYKK